MAEKGRKSRKDPKDLRELARCQVVTCVQAETHLVP